jgi:MoxR-like ATPase
MATPEKYHGISVSDSAIEEKETEISYMGVKLEKSATGDGKFVPKKEHYADFINDPEVALPLQRDIAISFLNGDPIVVEGGTSLGKTTTVKKMASDLGWEVHYVNLKGTTEAEDLMGRYVPNANKKNDDNPDFIFADGKVTSGLRQEEGKVKVIILDEFNAAQPNVLIRLHEVLDSLERGSDVVLSEDASETIPVSKEKTKIVALMNPPGKGYLMREPIDPAQLRRWVYVKMPSELPESTFSSSTDALFGAEPVPAKMEPAMFIRSRDTVLAPEQLQEIPGMGEMLAKYKAFHDGAKNLLKTRKIAEDQPQPFTYDDRMEPRRVRDFILRFYNGDINETFQQALRYYYSNKVESDVDRKQLEELIRLVECHPIAPPSKRKGVERDAPKEKKKSATKKTPATESKETFKGRDPEELLESFFNIAEEERDLTFNAEERSKWKYWECTDKSDGSVLIEMGINTKLLGGMKELLDKTEPMETADIRAGQGIENLLPSLKGKKVISIAAPDGQWFWKVLEPTEETADTTEKSSDEKETSGETALKWRDLDSVWSDLLLKTDRLADVVWIWEEYEGKDGSVWVDMETSDPPPGYVTREVILKDKKSNGKGYSKLKELIRGRKVASIKTPSGKWYLKVLEEKTEEKDAEEESPAVEKFEGRDPEDLMEKYYRLMEEHRHSIGHYEDQTFYYKKSDPNFFQVTLSLRDEFSSVSLRSFEEIFDKKQKINDREFNVQGHGYDELLSSLKGKKVVSILDPESRTWYWKVLEPTEETADTTKKSKKSSGKKETSGETSLKWRDLDDVWDQFLRANPRRYVGDGWVWKECKEREGWPCVDMCFNFPGSVAKAPDSLLSQKITIKSEGDKKMGYQSLKDFINGRKVASIKTPSGDWYLKILD